MATDYTVSDVTTIKVSRLRKPLELNGTKPGRKPRPSPPTCPMCGRAALRNYYRLGVVSTSLIVNYHSPGKYGYWFCVGVPAEWVNRPEDLPVGMKMHPIWLGQTPET